MVLCRNCSTRSANWRARNRGTRPAHRERRAQRHGRRAAGVGLHADSAQTHPSTQEGHDRRLRHLMRFPGVLPDLSLPSGLGTFQKDRSHPLGLSEHPGHPHRPGSRGARAGHHHPAPRPGRALRQAPPHRPLDLAHLALRKSTRRGGLRNALPLLSGPRHGQRRKIFTGVSSTKVSRVSDGTLTRCPFRTISAPAPAAPPASPPITAPLPPPAMAPRTAPNAAVPPATLAVCWPREPLSRETLCVLISDRKSTRLNSSHLVISYAVFCLKNKY